MEEVLYEGITYKSGDWVKLIRTPHGGYEVGDIYQIVEFTGKDNFSAKHKLKDTIQLGFSLRCHSKVSPESLIINSYPIF